MRAKRYRRRVRLRTYALATGAAIIAGALLALATTDGIARGEGRIGGDFVAFHAAGRMILEGHAGELYDAGAEARFQASTLPNERAGGAVLFAYPPYVALLYAPLAALPFRAAYVVHLALALAATIFAALALARAFPSLARDRGLAIGALLCLWPLWHATEIGQNTAFSLALFAAMLAAAHRDRDVPLGIAAGALLVKPPLALFALVALVSARRWRALGAALGVAGLFYALGAMVLGPAWPVTWVDALARFARLDAEGDLAFGISLFTIGDRALPGSGAALAALAAAALALAARRADPRARIVLAACAGVLVPPHAGFYEAGLVALPAALVVERVGQRALVPLLACWALLAIGYLAPNAVWVYALPMLALTAWAAIVTER